MTHPQQIDLLRTGPLGVNTFIVPLCGPYVLLVDPASCKESGDEFKITRALAQRSQVPLAVVLTHGHFDHVSGLKRVREVWPKIPIIIHKKDACYIGENSAAMQSLMLRSMGLEQFIPAVTNLPEPSAFLEEGKTLCETMEPLGIKDFSAVRGELFKWRVLHTPGHTPGCCCLYNVENKMILTGDTVFFHSWGRTDLPGGEEDAMVKSLKRIYSEIPGDTLVFPGHDAVAFALKENFSDLI